MGTEENGCRILQLSDCTMLYILSYLDATSLFNLSKTCLYFKNIVDDPCLWRFIDARNKPNTTKKVDFVCRRVHNKTTHLMLRAENKHNGVIRYKYLRRFIHFENLVVLALENQRLDGRMYYLIHLPDTLEELSFKKSHIKNGKMFFQGSAYKMRNLRVLILDECDWLESNFMMVIAKYDNLELLSIAKCQNLHFNIIPYLSIAKHGFNKLKLIDCRFSTISNEILKSFNTHRPLVALYCQSMKSYQLDKGKPIFSKQIPSLRNADGHLLLESIIKNQSLEQYLFAEGDDLEELPSSVLYKDPYTECTCKYRENEESERSFSSKENNPEYQIYNMFVDDYIDFNNSTQKFICRKHASEINKLPMSFKKVLYQNDQRPDTDSSGEDTDSDNGYDSNCCMFGVGTSKQIILLKVRETDDQGNMPEAEMIDISQLASSRENSDNNEVVIQDNTDTRQSNSNNFEPQPSTSHQNGDNLIPRDLPVSTAKRKAGDCIDETLKKTKMDESVDSRLFVNFPQLAADRQSKDISMPSTSQCCQGNASGSKSKSNYDNQTDGESQNKDISTPNISHGSQGNLTIKENESNYDNHTDCESVEETDSNDDFDVQAPPVPGRVYNHLPGFNGVIFRDIVNVNLALKVQLQNNNQDATPTRKIKLRRLSLRGYGKITDIALDLIKNLNLDLLDVTYTNVTKQQIENFLTFNPNCRVLHKDFCVCKPRIFC